MSRREQRPLAPQLPRGCECFHLIGMREREHRQIRWKAATGRRRAGRRRNDLGMKGRKQGVEIQPMTGGAWLRGEETRQGTKLVCHERTKQQKVMEAKRRPGGSGEEVIKCNTTTLELGCVFSPPEEQLGSETHIKESHQQGLRKDLCKFVVFASLILKKKKKKKTTEGF